MALRAVPDHPKFAHLKSILHAPKGPTLGWLESVWHFCGKFTQQGNIGKYPDSAIEAWVEWDGEPGRLIAALVESRWLERHVHYRLLVHDWHNHADATTRKFLGRTKLPFLTMPQTCTGQLPEKPQTLPTETEFAQDPQGQGQVSGPGSRNQGQGETPPTERTYDASETDVPAGMTAIQYAQGLLERCNIPQAFATQRAAASAMEAYAKEHSIELHRAAAALIELARSALDRGERVGKFWFEDGKYRGGTDGKPEGNSQGAAVGRVKRTGSAWDSAIEQRLAGANGRDVEADVGSVPTSGVRPGHNENLPDDIRGSGSEIRAEAHGASTAKFSNPAKVFSPPGRGGRGA